MLKVWFPGTNDTEDYGLGGTQWINDNVVITDNGKLGKCLSFNGSNSRLSTTTFNLSNEWSFCFWAKCNNASNGFFATIFASSFFAKLFKKSANTIHDVKAKYDSANSNVDKIVKILENHQISKSPLGCVNNGLTDFFNTKNLSAKEEFFSQ